MLSRLKDVFRPRRRGLHIKKTTVVRIVILSFFMATTLGGVVAYYEFYRIENMSQKAVKQALSEAQDKKVPVVQLLTEKGTGESIESDYKIVYLPETVVPENRIDVSVLKSGVYKARRPLAGHSFLTNLDIISAEEWLPDSVKIREFKECISVPEGTAAGDIVDVVLTRSLDDNTYEEFVVLSDKRIEYLNGRVLHFAMWTDEERYLMGRAMSEVKYKSGVELRLDHYPDAEIQDSAVVTYKSALLDEMDGEAYPFAEKVDGAESEVKENDSPTVSPVQSGKGHDDNKRTGDSTGP